VPELLAMNFLDTIFTNLSSTPEKRLLQEIQAGQRKSCTNAELLGSIDRTRRALRQAGLQAGDRCALLAPNSIQWVTLDLAIMAEGGIVVPLYSRQSPLELVQMMQDSSPRLLCCANAELREAVSALWPELPATLLFEEIFSPAIPHPPPILKEDSAPSTESPARLTDSSLVTIVYTSGTSGDAKGVVLTAGNITFMLQRTTARLVELMHNVKKSGDDRVFHYLPFCFAGSWILLLTTLYRNNALLLSTDLSKLSEDLQFAQPHYLLNVPALLDRIRSSIQDQLRLRGRLVHGLFTRAQRACLHQNSGQAGILDFLALALARILIFPKIKQTIGPNLQALICGSAPLSEETQLFFQMIGIAVLQVYGLTETTGICTMDDVNEVTVGRVGPAISGIEMKLGPKDEILVRGPNVFPGYWNRSDATAEVIQDGWFHTGDQGEVDAKGNWKIIGRLKNLLIPTSGHNISPEPLEQKLLSLLPDAEYAIVIGNGRKFLSAVISGNTTRENVESALVLLNQELPHYKQVRKFYLTPESFSTENGLLTTNRKIKRAAIEARYRSAIDELYRDPATSTTNRA
jgi:long-chain acyl-CoA synthetase